MKAMPNTCCTTTKATSLAGGLQKRVLLRAGPGMSRRRLGPIRLRQHGHQRGLRDIYGSGLMCQWVDMTEIDTGNYVLVIKVNWDQSPDALGRGKRLHEQLRQGLHPL